MAGIVRDGLERVRRDAIASKLSADFNVLTGELLPLGMLVLLLAPLIAGKLRGGVFLPRESGVGQDFRFRSRSPVATGQLR